MESLGQTRIRLTKEEVAICQYLGKARRENNRSNNISDQLVAKENALKKDIDGIGAELAFAKLYNLYPPMEIRPQAGTADFVIMGRTIDIKQSEHENARLIVPPSKIEGKGGCDAYVLATGALPYYIFRGFAKKEQLCNQKNLITLRSLVYALTIKELNPMPKYERNNLCS